MSYYRMTSSRFFREGKRIRKETIKFYDAGVLVPKALTAQTPPTTLKWFSGNMKFRQAVKADLEQPDVLSDLPQKMTERMRQYYIPHYQTFEIPDHQKATEDTQYEEMFAEIGRSLTLPSTDAENPWKMQWDKWLKTHMKNATRWIQEELNLSTAA